MDQRWELVDENCLVNKAIQLCPPRRLWEYSLSFPPALSSKKGD